MRFSRCFPATLHRPQSHALSHTRNNRHDEIVAKCRETFGYIPNDWQLEAVTRILDGFDSVVIAGTGSGKSLVFMLPAVLCDTTIVMVVSPLKALQLEQSSMLYALGVSSAAVNEDTANVEMLQNIERGEYRALFTSPETLIRNKRFYNIFATSSFRKRLLVTRRYTICREICNASKP